MRLISLNVNGLRAASRKGLWAWLAEQQADIVCLQELKAQPEQLAAPEFHPPGWHSYYHCAQRKGYAGVGLLSRVPPDTVLYGLAAAYGDSWADIDAEGRYLEARWGKLAVVSLYLHSGSSGAERQALKFDFMRRLTPHLAALQASGREYALCGDWNIAHTERDLKNWRGNRKNSGFLPEERAWLDSLFSDGAWVDAYRRLYPDAEGEAYTWWSNRGAAWAKNVGWRIDYQIVTPRLAATLHSASVYKAARFADHAPLSVNYDCLIPHPGEPN